MKRTAGTITFIILLSGLVNTGILFSQTAGTFTLSLYTTSTGGYSPRHLVAIWIESSTPSFVKTRLIQSSGSNLDHLALWTSRTGSSYVDATSGATLLTHGNITVVWNGTDVSGNVVPDGTYTAWVEMAWAASYTTGKTYSLFTFTKGPSTFHSNPPNTTNFYTISLDWAPSTPTSVEKVQAVNEVLLFPNPAKEILNVRFKKAHSSSIIRMYNEAGIQVYQESLIEFPGTEKTIDISRLPAGVYFVNFHFEDKDESIRIVKTK